MMDFRRRAVIDVEGNPKAVKTLRNLRMVFVYNLLRTNTFFLSFYRDGCAMLIRAANMQHIVTVEALKTSKDIRRNIGSCQMSDMEESVCIRQCGSYSKSFGCLRFQWFNIKGGKKAYGKLLQSLYDRMQR